MNPTQPEHATFLEMMHLPSHWPVQADLLQWCHDMGPGMATILIIGSAVYLLFGWHIFKTLVMLNAALVGAYIGGRIGNEAGSFAAGAGIGAVLAAAVTWPLMKYAVAAMGGIFGALL